MSSTARPATILVVDDDADTCRNLRDILSDIGYTVDTAHNGSEALEKVRIQPYDVALLDLKMPDMDGITLYREIRKLRSSAVALIVTAFAATGTTEEAIAAGAWRVLPKPVDLRNLLGLVQKAVDQPVVMVVDDDRDLCSNLWELLRDRGFRVAVAHDVREAEDRLSDHSYRVILIDLRLPDSDGTSLFRLVRNYSPSARTVVITGHRDEYDNLVEQVLTEGADAVCYKPFDIPSLLGLLERLTNTSPEKP
ncbi:MAG: response regulator [Gemmataceae bacterium]